MTAPEPGGGAGAASGAGAEVGRREPLVYLAGPDGFTVAGLAWHRGTVVPALQAAGMVPLSPWDHFTEEFETLAGLPPGPERQVAYRQLDLRVGAANVALIDRASAMLALLDGVDVDSGTAAEIGYACARIPVVGLRTDVRPAGDNEGAVVNLQVEYFIHLSGGDIHRTLDGAARALGRLLLGSAAPG